MRIAQVSAYYTPALVGGAEVFVSHLAGALSARGHTVEAFCTAREAADELIDGIPVHRRPNHNLYWTPDAGAPSAAARALWHLRDLHNPAGARATARAIRDFAPDVIHLHQLSGFSPALYGALRRELGAVPIVHTLHDFWHACARQTLLHGSGRICDGPWGVCALHSRAAGRAARAVDRFIAPSRFLGDWYAEHGILPRERIEVLPNGIPPAPTAAVARNRVRQRGSPLRVLFLGQLVAHKGIGTLLLAAQRLPPELVSIRIAGAGPLSDAVRASQRVQFLGSVSDSAKHHALLEADVLVAPSEWYENQPLTILEGLHYGLAIIASAIGGIPELVEPDTNGLLHPPGDAAALADALLAAAGDPQRLARWQTGALERAAEFNMARTTERHQALYQRLVVRR